MSGYTIRTSGKASLKSFDVQCPECKYTEGCSVDLRDCETEAEQNERIDRDTLIKCPNCEEATMERVWLQAPGGFDREGSDKEIKKYQNYTKSRFIKKEIDDVRHKHGVNFDDALRSSAATRIKKGEKPIS